jgi:hypothetical protein
MNNEKEIISLAKRCIAMEENQKERPELLWLKEKYKRFCRENEVTGKAEADRLIYRTMYGCEPENDSAALKIRYWRTGHHTPTNREQCEDFGEALGLDGEELTYLLQWYYDRSIRSFDEQSLGDPEYIRRKNCIDLQVGEYLAKVHPGWRMHMNISKIGMRNSLRHLYYMEAMQYVDVSKSADEEKKSKTGHYTSISYDSEFSRHMKLFGEIPRKTMIRHLLIFGMPYMNREILDERLETLGYLPLCEEHTLTGGEHLDWLLIRLLELYTECCRGKEPEMCSYWFQNACSILDGYFRKAEKENLRFMYFKALNG